MDNDTELATRIKEMCGWKEGEKELMKKYSFLKPKNVRRSLMVFGLECGEGWFPLIDELCSKIEMELEKNPELKKHFHVLQIKEKLGGLRFYVSGGNNQIEDLIDEAAEKSYTICEDCGKNGKERKLRGWIRTQCNDCYKEWKIGGRKIRR